MRRLFSLILLLFAASICRAEDWPAILSRMPLPDGTTHLTRTNCVAVMLRAFQSNQIIKALVFLPGATDEFYMFRRASAHLSMSKPTLFDAVCALTNQTRIRVASHSPFLLLRTEIDPLEPQVAIQDSKAVGILRDFKFTGRVEFNDVDWDSLQPLLKKGLRREVQPWRYSPDAYHFYRCAFAGWNLSGWEMIEAVTLASRTRAIIERGNLVNLGRSRIRFEDDVRPGLGR